MPTRSPPPGNLTAGLVVAAWLELIVNRLLGHLFAVPTCHTTLGCVSLRLGPFLLYLTGVLALVVIGAGLVGLLWRGELLPRGMRFTTGALALVFVLLLATSLVLGRVPARYEAHLKTSFGFVILMLALAFAVSAPVRARGRVGVVLMVLPPLLHVGAVVATQATWWRDSWVQGEQMTFVGELFLIVAAALSPFLLLPWNGKRSHLAPALALAAGLTAFSYVAWLGRPDLIGALGLYGLHLDLPRASSLLGIAYAIALLGYSVTLAVFLMDAGPGRLAGLGLALLALGGYQTASPVELALTLAGMIALTTGLQRLAVAPRTAAPVSSEAWKSLLGGIGQQIRGDGAGETTPPAPVEIEIVSGDGTDSDRAVVRTRRKGRPIELVARRSRSALEGLTVVVGSRPAETGPDATIESHETWLARLPETRPAAPRVKTDDPTFDRKWGVYGRAPLGDRALRRRVLAQGDATIKLWAGIAAELEFAGRTGDGSNGVAGRGRDPLRSLIETIDLLGDLLEASAPAPAPSPQPAPSLPS